MYFHNKFIYSYKYKYYLLKTWSNVKHFILTDTYTIVTSFPRYYYNTYSISNIKKIGENLMV